MNNRQVALVTGASRGIGRAVAIGLARLGFDCVVNYAKNADAAEDVCREIAALGVRGVAVRADVSVAADRRALVGAVYEKLGRLDVLVSNAGIAPRKRADILEAEEESFDELISVNLKGPYFLIQEAARRMIAARGISPSPKIVIISSVSAYTASTNRGDYCIAKAGLSMVRALYASRLAEHGIGVYEIRPGVIETDMTGPVKERYDKLILEGDLTPIKRWGKPDDIARCVGAIATDAFPFSTGNVFDVDGGFHLRRL